MRNNDTGHGSAHFFLTGQAVNILGFADQEAN